MQNNPFQQDILQLVHDIKELRTVVQQEEPDVEKFVETFRTLFQHVKALQGKLGDEEMTQQVVTLSKPVLELAVSTKNNLTKKTGNQLLVALISYVKSLGDLLNNTQ